jgi:hypothetical protein
MVRLIINAGQPCLNDLIQAPKFKRLITTFNASYIIIWQISPGIEVMQAQVVGRDAQEGCDDRLGGMNLSCRICLSFSSSGIDLP